MHVSLPLCQLLFTKCICIIGFRSPPSSPEFLRHLLQSSRERNAYEERRKEGRALPEKEMDEEGRDEKEVEYVENEHEHFSKRYSERPRAGSRRRENFLTNKCFQKDAAIVNDSDKT